MDAASITLTPVRPLKLVLAPGGGTLSAGEVVQFSAELASDDLAGESVPAVWSSSNADVVRVTDEGVVHALRVGSAYLSAAGAGQQASVPLLVTRVGVARLLVTPARHSMAVADQVQLHVTAQDGFGSRLPGRVVTWSSDQPAVAAVSRSGLVEARAPGFTQIGAASGGQSAVLTLRVDPAVVATVRVTPASATLAPGEAQQFHAVAVNAQGRPVPGIAIEWASSDEAVARVDQTGAVVGLRAGSVRVAAAARGRRTLVGVTVFPRRRVGP